MFPLDSLSAPAPIVPAAPAKKPASKRKTVTKNTTEASTATAEKETGEPFSYKDCNPEPAIVYTCHEEEANDLVQNLRGYVFFIRRKSTLILVYRPIGFDMEWRVMFHRNLPTGARRTAVVQLCDKLMILIVQVSAMKSTPVCHHSLGLSSYVAQSFRRKLRYVRILHTHRVITDFQNRRRS